MPFSLHVSFATIVMFIIVGGVLTHQVIKKYPYDAEDEDPIQPVDAAIFIFVTFAVMGLAFQHRMEGVAWDAFLAVLSTKD